MCCMTVSFSGSLRTVSSSWSSLLAAQAGSIPSASLPSQVESWYIGFFPHMRCSACKPAEPAVWVQRRHGRTCASAYVFMVLFSFPFSGSEVCELRTGSIALTSLYSVMGSVWHQHTGTPVLSPEMAFRLESSMGCLTMKKSKNPLWWLPFFHHMGFFLPLCYHAISVSTTRISFLMQG